MAPQVLLVEDDPDIAPTLIMALQREGHVVTHAPTGTAAVEHVAGRATDVVLLDLGLPDIDGLEVCRRIRAQGYEGAVLIVTARDGELDRVVGLDVGADDYPSKPFSPSELLARIRAVLRRGWAVAPAEAREVVEPAQAENAGAPQVVQPVGRPVAGDPTPTTPITPPPSSHHAAVAMPDRPTSASTGQGLTVDTRSRRAFVAAAELPLTAKEFDVLALLDAERGAAITRERLMSEVWDENWFGSTKTLDATVGRLRQKLETSESPTRISTVRGVGFRLEDALPDA
jgi:DNA-binding response OmpR family regulator